MLVSTVHSLADGRQKPTNFPSGVLFDDNHVYGGVVYRQTVARQACGRAVEDLGVVHALLGCARPVPVGQGAGVVARVLQFLLHLPDEPAVPSEEARRLVDGQRLVDVRDDPVIVASLGSWRQGRGGLGRLAHQAVERVRVGDSLLACEVLPVCCKSALRIPVCISGPVSLCSMEPGEGTSYHSFRTVKLSSVQPPVELLICALATSSAYAEKSSSVAFVALKEVAVVARLKWPSLRVALRFPWW